MDSARKAAYLALRDIEENNAYSGLAIKSAVSRLSPENIAFTRELVYGTIKKQIFFDYLINSLIKTEVSKLPVSDRVLLRMGFSQLSSLDSVPDYAAVSETVELAKRYSPGRDGFINGVLRTYIREKENMELPEQDEDLISWLSLKYSFAPWIIEMWMDEYKDQGFVERLLDSLNQKPCFCIRVNTLKTTTAKLKTSFEELGYTVKTDEDLPDILFLDNIGAEKPLSTELYKKGYFSVQDKASRLAAYSLGVKPGDFVIDVCAAPGGKAMAMAESMGNKGRIIAMDIHAHRLKLIKNEAERLGITIIELLHCDAREGKKEFYRIADRVLVDVPCSGLGTAKRKPEVKYKAYDDRMKTLPETQLDILNASSDYVKPGGVLVYSTCTIANRENQDVTGRFLADNEEFELVDMFRLMPMTGNTDGFFVCKLKRREDLPWRK